MSSLRASAARTESADNAYVFEVVDGGPARDVTFINQSLSWHNAEKAGESGYRPLHIFVRDSKGAVVAGVLGTTYWGWLVLDIIWVDAKLRGHGYGRKLLRMAEAEAINRRCQHSYLDTFSFQGAMPFYKAEGYLTFGALEGFPTGHRRFFMKKDLVPRAPADNTEVEARVVSEAR